MSDDATSRLTRKGRATRARIIDVAARLMFERGVGGTSIDEVRGAATVSGSQISHYFDAGTMGIYNLAYSLSEMPTTQVGEQIGDVLLPSFAQMTPPERRDALGRSMALRLTLSSM